LSILAILLTGAIVETRAQDSQSGSPLDRKVGAAEVYYLKDKNKMRAQVRIYLSGQAQDILAGKDVLTLDVVFEVTGTKLTQPKNVYFAFTSYFAEKPRFHKDNNLQLYSDGVGGLDITSWRTQILSSKSNPSGGGEEIYYAAIQYDKFVRVVNAREAVVSLGESRFSLKKDQLEMFQDLNATIEK
jgi:hypothetical protein